MSAKVLDVYVNATPVGTLVEEARASVFTYLPDVQAHNLVSLLLPARAASYKWAAGLLPFFQMNLPEGYKKDLVRRKLGAHADVSDQGLLALTGANGIGRVRVVPRGVSADAPASSLDMASLLAATGSRDNLLRQLEAGITEGVSGVMPKMLARPEDKATVWTDEFILKTGPADLPGLSVNEFLCLEVARHAGLEVPETQLSEDGEVLAIRRFDRLANAGRLAVEDFCALKGLDPVNKYKGSLEDLAKLSSIYVSAPHRKESARRLFTLLLVNYALRNADAHLKNFAVVYTSAEDVRLAPVYDIVTVTAYPEYQADIPGLPLAGKRAWASGQWLTQYGGARLSLSRTDMAACVAQVTEAVRAVLPMVAECAGRYPEFREIAKRMLAAWAQGLEDIKPDARPGKSTPTPLREEAGLSGPGSLAGKKKTNLYVNPDGAFGHKAR
ncbi:type II toxin-antitoxin system HipA family toxin [Cupriavidus basilensis]|nr:type II toxin-antitoxin system HipA family toxin [Cupriavidus basilensis]